MNLFFYKIAFFEYRHYWYQGCDESTFLGPESIICTNRPTQFYPDQDSLYTRVHRFQTANGHDFKTPMKIANGIVKYPRFWANLGDYCNLSFPVCNMISSPSITHMLLNAYIYAFNILPPHLLTYIIAFNPRIHTPGKIYPKQVSDFGSNMVLLFFWPKTPM